MPLEKRDLVRGKCGEECGNYMSRGRDGEDPDSTNMNGLSHNSSLRSGLHFNQVSSKNIRTLPWITGRIPKAFLGEKEQFMEGGLRKQTLTTKNKAFCFCNKMQLEEMGAELAWSFWLILPIYELTTHKAWRLKLACYNRAFRQSKNGPGMLWISFLVTQSWGKHLLQNKSLSIQDLPNRFLQEKCLYHSRVPRRRPAGLIHEFRDP